jgi:hypothetical protein
MVLSSTEAANVAVLLELLQEEDQLHPDGREAAAGRPVQAAVAKQRPQQRLVR